MYKSPPAEAARQPVLATLLPVMTAVLAGFSIIGVALPVLPLYVNNDLGFGPGSKVTLAQETRAGGGGAFIGSRRTVPVNHSSGPFLEGCEPARLSSMYFLIGVVEGRVPHDDNLTAGHSCDKMAISACPYAWEHELKEDFNDLVGFMTVARERNFTRAAAQMGVSQSALSRTVAGLERRMGLQLLTRTTRSVSLTEAGDRLLSAIAPRFEEIEAEVDSLRAMTNQPSGTV